MDDERFPVRHALIFFPEPPVDIRREFARELISTLLDLDRSGEGLGGVTARRDHGCPFDLTIQGDADALRWLLALVRTDT
jgi:hypothetical protein